MSAIHFCDKCSKIMKVESHAGLVTAVCSCGNYKQLDSGIKIASKIQSKKDNSKGVFDASIHNKGDEGFPHTCPKCGHGEADVKDLGAFFSDESNVYLFKCRKCGYVYRQADGCSNM
ncbi:hypothetical protein J4447_03160 [Candidatus Pacearchaeota archaeon]|nr:hypothetical protein [Candidatus Pacearchaeota archaeon]